MPEPIEELREKLRTANEAAQDIAARADDERRDLTVEEKGRMEELLSEFDRLEKEISLREKLEAQTLRRYQGTGRLTAPAQPGAGVDPDAAPDEYEPAGRTARVHDLRPAPSRQDAGYRSIGEFALDVKAACRPGGLQALPGKLARLLAPTSYQQEGVGADGGFAVPPDFRNEIMVKVMGEESLLARCDQLTTMSNSITVPKDEVTPWGTTGIQSYWEGEADQHTQSKGILQQITTRLNKLVTLVGVTEESLEDASAMDSYLRRKAPEQIGFKVNFAILQGTGVGMPLGILNADCTVSIAKETSQTADTLIALNVIKMWSRMYAPCRANAAWFIHQDIEPYLAQLSLPGLDNVGNAATNWGTHIYMPAGGISGATYSTLFGRPVIPTQACETLGDKGDIILADLTKYMAVLKSGPNPRVETSMHLWFDYDVMAYKFVLRLGGQPWWSSSVAARDGSNTYSCFVTLDERGT